MNDVALCVEPHTAAPVSKCDNGRGERIPCLLSQGRGIGGRLQMLEYGYMFHMYHAPKGDLILLK